MVKNVRVEYFFGYDLANIAKVEEYVRESVKNLSDFEMFYGMGDDVMNKLFIKSDEIDEKLLELISSCDGKGNFSED
jgi:hypothetical protein